MNILIALGIPFIGTTLGAAMVFFMKEKIAPKLEKAVARLCVRRDDCCIGLVASDSFDRYDGGTGRHRVGCQRWSAFCLASHFYCYWIP